MRRVEQRQLQRLVREDQSVEARAGIVREKAADSEHQSMGKSRACDRVLAPFPSIHVRATLVSNVVKDHRQPFVPARPNPVAFSPRESHGERVPQKLVDAEEE